MPEKNYNQLLAAEARHWDEFEREYIEKENIIPWWVDLQKATLAKKNTNEGLSPFKENLIRGKYKKTIINCCLPGSRILDVGCGSGWLALELARKGCLVTAIDVSPYRISLAREHYNRTRAEEGFLGTINYICGDVKDLKLVELDVVVAWDSLHHLPDLDNLFLQFNGSLKPDGQIVCYDHLGSKFIGILGKFRRLFVKEKISAFENVSQQEIVYFLEKHFLVLEKEYKISAPFRLISFLLFRYDFFNFLISPLVKIDEFLANKIKFLGQEFVFIKAIKK